MDDNATCPKCGMKTVERSTGRILTVMPPLVEYIRQCGCGWVSEPYVVREGGRTWLDEWKRINGISEGADDGE